MFKSIIISKKYWKSVLLIAFCFILIFSIIEDLMQYGSIMSDTFMEQKITNGRWVRYLISRLTGGFFYGTIMAYYFELRKRKARQ